jgi:osmoprotectant transport system ATP-binding protein
VIVPTASGQPTGLSSSRDLSADPVLEVQEASKCYDGVPALQQVSLTIAAGRTAALIGPSGCGKSTLLRLMNGLLLPDSGTIYFMGDAVTRNNASVLRRHMGYVIQEGGLFPHLTAHGNISLMASFLGWPRRRLEQRVAELAELTRFPTAALDRYPTQRSGGQCQRVALMRALMLDPQVLLLDEPLGALDPMIRYELQTDLKIIFQTLCKTVVLVTHDLAEAGHFSDNVVLLRNGRIEQQGPMRLLIEAPATSFVKQFVNAQRSLAGRLSP